jgi:hypothetical protein
MIPDLYAHVPVYNQHAYAQAGQDGLQKIVELVKLSRALAHLLIYRLKLIDSRLKLLIGRLQLLPRIIEVLL